MESQYWTEVEYLEQMLEVCTFRSKKTCEEVTEEICISMPRTECVLVPDIDCNEEKRTVKARDDNILTVEYLVTTCTPGDLGELMEVRQVPVCEERVEEQCDSQWGTDDVTGDWVWEGGVNCRNETLEDCWLEEREVVEHVQTNNCGVSSVLSYEVPQQVVVEVLAETTMVSKM